MSLTERDLEKQLRGATAGVDAGAATRALIERAEREDLLDVAYATIDSPFGELVVAGTGRGVVKISFGQESPDEVVEELAWTISPRILEAPARLDPVRRELSEYFDGRLDRFTVPLDWQLIHGFQTKVLRATAAIPYGETRSYGEVAAEAGNRRAFRAAGTALGRNPLPLIVPCHRVLRAGGVIGNYGGGPEMKESLLKLEGALPED
jgi:methylated-DNA-[protein]-cysteine S-methyltransferase